MKKTLTAACVALAALSGAANAASITITPYGNANNASNNASVAAINAAFSAATVGGVVENFETGYSHQQTGPFNGTAVGDFRTFGNATGTGSTCGVLNASGTCTKIAIQNSSAGAVNGQGNIIPFNGNFSLNSADTLGIVWDVALLGGGAFTKVVFALRDAADISGTIFNISTGTGADMTSSTITNGANANLKLVTIDFGEARTAATINLRTARNDAFTLDGATVLPAPVPLPAAGLLLVGGLGALGALRKRKAAAAV